MYLKTLLIASLPSGGKDFLGGELARNYGFYMIGAGSILRQHVNNGGPYAQKINDCQRIGALVPDHIVTKLVWEEVTAVLNRNSDARFIFNGYSRSVPQAQKLLEMLNKIGPNQFERANGAAALLHIDVPVAVCLNRMIKGSEERGERPDDNLETFHKRVQNFHKETRPMINFFRHKKRDLGVARVSLPGEQPAGKVYAQIVQALNLPASIMSAQQASA